MDWNTILEQLDRDEIAPAWEHAFDADMAEAWEEDAALATGHDR